MVMQTMLSEISTNLASLNNFTTGAEIDIKIKKLILKLRQNYPDQVLKGILQVRWGENHLHTNKVINTDEINKSTFSTDSNWAAELTTVRHILDEILWNYYLTPDLDQVEVWCSLMQYQRVGILNWMHKGGKISRDHIDLVTKYLFGWLLIHEYFLLRVGSQSYLDANKVCWSYTNFCLHSTIEAAVLGPTVKHYWLNGAKTESELLWLCARESYIFDLSNDDIKSRKLNLNRDSELILAFDIQKGQSKSNDLKVLSCFNENFDPKDWINRVSKNGKVRS